METKSFKALSIERLQGNTQGNIVETGGNIDETIDPKNFLHYCPAGLCHCSERLPGKNFPRGCISFKCEYHQGAKP